ncbi:MAG: serpin family protein [Novosphingobium sp.]|uniref:serpin family protein n=1 Tax=Novosphingobium sp. TaxID=1874826 RepID=UPI0032B7BB7D
MIPYLKQCAVLALLTLTAQPSLAQEGPPDEVPARFVPVALDADGRRVVAASNAFTLDLLKKVGSPTENIVLSPASVSMAVGFAYRGAAGKTAAELRTTLHYPFDPVQNLAASKGVLDSLELDTPQRELHAANAIWTQHGMPFDAEFERDMARYATAGLRRFDLKGDEERGRQTINEWVGGTTRGKIPELIAKGIITPRTRAVLVNALYFKAAWASAFEPESTKDEPFTSLDGRRAKVRLMTRRGYYTVDHRDGVKAILLPFVGGEISLAVFLPDRPGRLSGFAAKLTASDLERRLTALDRAERRETILSLPRFSLKWSGNLEDPLMAMGAPTAFSDTADFSGMAKLPSPGGDRSEIGLKISHVIHAATFDVDEVGSEASAATAVVMDVVVSGRLVRRPPPPPFIFRADKPFLFALRDNRTGLLLFVGRYVKP